MSWTHIPPVRRNPRPLFGYWLPFVGFRREFMYADEACNICEGPEGWYDLLMAEWFGWGLLLAAKRVVL